MFTLLGLQRQLVKNKLNWATVREKQNKENERITQLLFQKSNKM